MENERLSATLTSQFIEEITDTLSDTIIITDCNFNICRINSSASKMLGFEFTELYGEPISKIFGEGFPGRTDREKFIVNGSLHINRIYCLTKEGIKIPVVLQGKALFDETEKCKRIFLVLKKLEDKTSQPILNRSSFSIAIVDLKGRIEFVNQKYSELTGIKIDHILNKPHYFSESEGLSEKVKKHLTICIQNGQEWKGEVEYMSKSGNLLYCFLVIMPIMDESGVAHRCVIINEDVGQQKRKESQLTQELEMFSLVNLLNEISAYGGDLQSILKASVFGIQEILNDVNMVICIASESGKYLDLQYFAQENWMVRKIEKLIDRPIPKIRIELQNAPIHQKMLFSSGFIILEEDEINKWFLEYLNSTKLPIKHSKKGADLLYHTVRNLIRFKYVIAVPLVFNNIPIGTINMTSINPFTDDTIARLKTISVLIANIIKRSQLEDELKEKNMHLRSLGKHRDQVLEEERKRIARELHDNLGQMITALRMDISTMRKNISIDGSHSKPETLRNELTNSIRIIDNMLISLRKISQELRPHILDNLGIIETFDWYLQNFGKRYKISYKFSPEVNEKDLNEHQSINIFRIFQEILTNIARHSRATDINVRLATNYSDFLLEVRDNGKGISEAEIKSPNALGIIGMKELASFIEGELSIVGEKAIGTLIMLKFPQKQLPEKLIKQ